MHPPVQDDDIAAAHTDDEWEQSDMGMEDRGRAFSASAAPGYGERAEIM